MKIVISKKNLAGRKNFDFGYRYNDEGRVIGMYQGSAGKLAKLDLSGLQKEVKATAAKGQPDAPAKQSVLDEKALAALTPLLEANPLVAALDPGFVDAKTFGAPRAFGRIRFDSIDENSPTVQKLRALGVTDQQLRDGFLLHDPASFPSLEVMVV